MKRKSTGKALRFAIFARDGFTCRYCGQQADKVVLELDHIIPVSKGGTNDETNLITSCFDCNRGKGAKRIEQAAPTEQDRLRLAQQMNEQTVLAKRAVKARKESEKLEQEVVNFWCAQTGRDSVHSATIKTVARYVREVGPDVVFRWIEHAAANPQRAEDDQAMGRYVSGIRRSWIEEQKTP